jgi:quercetin 2,3-dioxygenase
MITLYRAEQRRRIRRDHGESWLTFFAQDRSSPLADSFGAIELLNEGRLPPAATVPLRPRHGVEIVTYVREGALAQRDWMGRSGVIHAGEFQCRTVGRGVRLSETNASQTELAHVLQIWLRPAEAPRESSHEQKRFSTAERRGELCVVASPDGQRGSLRVHQDILIYSALLDPGRHLIHELLPGRSAWIHLVQGEATLGDVVLSTGDGAGVTADRAVSITAREESEILFLDLGDQRTRSAAPRPPSN